MKKEKKNNKVHEEKSQIIVIESNINIYKYK